MGKAFKELNLPREQLVVSTKIFKISNKSVNDTFLSRKHIIEGTRNSLKRLQLDYVDVLFCHRPDFDTPLEETCRAMNWVIEKGWAHYWGTSEWPAERIATAIELCTKRGWARPIVEQCEYNMLRRDNFEKNYRNLFAEQKYGSTIWSPLASGILSGKYNDGNIPQDSRFGSSDSLNFVWVKYMSQEKDKTCAKLRKLADLAKELGTTQPVLCLAWAIAS